MVRVVNISNINKLSWNTSADVLLNWDTSIFLPGKIETENKQSVDNSCLLDRVAAVDSRLVRLSVRSFCVSGGRWLDHGYLWVGLVGGRLDPGLDWSTRQISGALVQRFCGTESKAAQNWSLRYQTLSVWSGLCTRQGNFGRNPQGNCPVWHGWFDVIWPGIYDWYDWPSLTTLSSDCFVHSIVVVVQ